MLNNSSIREWVGYWIESRRDLRLAVTAFFATSAPILGALLFAVAFLPQAHRLGEAPIPGVVHGCYHFDALHYLDIIEHGYAYDWDRTSTVAFFPVFPLTAHGLTLLSGLECRLALLVVSNLFLLGAFILLGVYARERSGQATPVNGFLTLLLFGLVPATFFFRMPYSESTFLFFTLLAMIGINSRWPLPLCQ